MIRVALLFVMAIAGSALLVEPAEAGNDGVPLCSAYKATVEQGGTSPATVLLSLNEDRSGLCRIETQNVALASFPNGELTFQHFGRTHYFAEPLLLTDGSLVVRQPLNDFGMIRSSLVTEFTVESSEQISGTVGIAILTGGDPAYPLPFVAVKLLPLVGDANCSGTVESTDALTLLQFQAAFPWGMTSSQNADVTGDGILDSRDALLILQYSAGLLDHL